MSKKSTAVMIAALMLPITILLLFIPGSARPSKKERLNPTFPDVTYASVDGVDLKLDIYQPQRKNSSLSPLAVYVHGGGWEKGDKRGGEGLRDAPELLKRGYVVASINYRLAPQYQFPDNIEDVKAAIRFLRANADKYSIDPARIGVWGTSAGGHLVSLLGTADASAGFDNVGGNLGVSSRVQAVVDMYGPGDLTKDDFQQLHADLLPEVFGNMLAAASPVNYASQDDPPFLIMQGDRDRVVPLNQSQEFFDKLSAAGASAQLVIVKNAGHGFIPVRGAETMPTREEITRIMADFFDQHLK